MKSTTVLLCHLQYCSNQRNLISLLMNLHHFYKLDLNYLKLSMNMIDFYTNIVGTVSLFSNSASTLYLLISISTTSPELVIKDKTSNLLCSLIYSSVYSIWNSLIFLLKEVVMLAVLIELYSIRFILKGRYSSENNDLLLPTITKSHSDQKRIKS